MRYMAIEINPFVYGQTLTILDGDRVESREIVPQNFSADNFADWVMTKAHNSSVDTIELICSNDAFDEISKNLQAAEMKRYSANTVKVEHFTL